MNIYVLLEKPLSESEAFYFRGFQKLTPKWLSTFGFSFALKVPAKYTKFISGNALFYQYHYDEKEKKESVFEAHLNYYRTLALLRYSPDFDSRVNEVEARLNLLEGKLQGLLKPCREFAFKQVCKEEFVGFGKGAKRQKELLAREALLAKYNEVKHSPEYLQVLQERDAVIHENHLVLEAKVFPKDEEEAKKILAETTIRVLKNRALLLTIPQKIEQIKAEFAKYKKADLEHYYFMNMLELFKKNHRTVGILNDFKLQPRPIGELSYQNENLLENLPVPSKRLFLLRP